MIGDKLQSEMSLLEKSLQDYCDDYFLDLSIKAKDTESYYRLFLLPTKEDLKYNEIIEVYGVSKEDLRLNFFIKLADLRKQVIDKLTKKA